MSKKLTVAVQKRLEKLATYLENLPADYQHFGMATIIDSNDDEVEYRYARKNGGVPSCGTSACAIGHGPAAGVLVPSSLVSTGVTKYGNSKWWSVDWDSYSLKFTGEPDVCTPLWEWMFGGRWERIDDHHFGAAARIRFVLANGHPPLTWDGEHDADAFALYREYDKRRVEQPA